MVFNDRFIRRRALIAWASVPFIMFAAPPLAQPGQQAWSPVDIPGPDEHPAELIQLTEEFRTILGWGSGVPDYAGTVGRQKEKLPEFRARLEALDTADWSVHEKIDYLLLRSEMDRLEFDLYVWRQTSRNPSFYVAQAIRNVGRHLTGGRRMYVPELMPYTKERAQTILQALADTPKIVAQGRRNLTEMVPALADMALRNPGSSIDTDDLDNIVENYRKWAEVTAEHFPEPEASQLVSAAEEAARHLLEFGNWCLRYLLLVICAHPFAKEAFTLHLARSEGHERYFGCNLMHRKVLASSYQHLMAEAPAMFEQVGALVLGTSLQPAPRPVVSKNTNERKVGASRPFRSSSTRGEPQIWGSEAMSAIQVPRPVPELGSFEIDHKSAA